MSTRNPRFNQDPQAEFTRRITVLTDHGVELPAEFAEVRQQAIDDDKASQRRAILDRRVAAIRSALAAGASALPVVTT